MVYSKKIQDELDKKKIKIGEEVEIEIKTSDKSGSVSGKKYTGLLMPRPDIGNHSTIVLKLENGYNVGIDCSKDFSLKKIEHKHKELKEEKDIELGKIKEKPKTNFDSKKPTISILGCGGTIASRVEYKTGAVFPAFDQSDILKIFPSLENFSNIKPRKLFDLLSEDMHPAHWEIIAKEAAEEIKSGSSGVVLMHGTDTMHYTSAALSFMIQNLPVPIVLVGAQRSSDRGSSDNLQNLLCAARIGLSDIAEVSVCMHATSSDDYCFAHRGTRIRKMHTSRRDAFRSINTLPLAKVWQDGKIEYLRKDYNTREKRNLKLDTKMNPNVCLIQSHPAIKSEFIQSLSKFYDGVVISATGLGHLPSNAFGDRLAKNVIPSVKSLIDSGVPVVIAPQTIYGRIEMNVYTAGRLLEEAGAIGNNCDWTPETALVKLMWVLGHTKNLDEVKKLMLTNITGEISERSLPETFLY